MEFNLPKKYLSFSAMDVWLKSKDQYRKRYYEDSPSFETAETIFGKRIHKMFEDDPNVRGSETKIELELVPGLKLLGYIDSLDPDTLAIIDFKTGRVPWDNIKVKKHKQLVFYSLLVLEKHGRYNREVALDWIETRLKDNSVKWKGHTFLNENKELELTGHRQKFTRKVYKYEIDNLREQIIQTAKEISNDYTKYRQGQHN